MIGYALNHRSNFTDKVETVLLMETDITNDDVDRSL
jgi:hypothetical protein